MTSHTERVLLLAIAGISLAIATSVRAQDAQAGHDHAGEHFGAVHVDTSCSAAVQPQFDRAVAMLHSFFYPETDKAFQAIADREPSCAMAYWGVAISTRPNPLTAPFAPALLKRGYDAIQKARAAAPNTARERDWIDALAPFFDGHDTVDQLTRTRRYAAAMEALHAKYPNDSEIAVFYALSLLEAVDLTDTTYRGQLKAAALLERLQRRQPDHPGIVHYLIHSYDYAPIAAKGLPAARRYAKLAPSAPHALHMPSHIFSTLGMWPEAIQTNLVADRANIAYAETSNPKAAANTATIVARYHALDFLTYAYLQLAQDRQAKAILDQRNMIATMSSEERITAHTAYAAIPVRYALERGAWKEAAALPPIRTPFKEAEAIVWFGRVVGAARSDDRASATRDLAELSRLRQELTAPGADPYWAEQVAILEQAASAWVALGETRKDDAVAAMREAANREDRTEKHVAMENRLWPMRELLGELLIDVGRPREALREFERSMRVVPNRFRSLAGAGRAASDAGNRKLALTYYRKLLAQTANAEGDRPELAAARQFLASR
jgi:tetratricopeptide (TPR) repeat protein